MLCRFEGLEYAEDHLHVSIEIRELIEEWRYSVHELMYVSESRSPFTSTPAFSKHKLQHPIYTCMYTYRWDELLELSTNHKTLRKAPLCRMHHDEIRSGCNTKPVTIVKIPHK